MDFIEGLLILFLGRSDLEKVVVKVLFLRNFCFYLDERIIRSNIFSFYGIGEVGEKEKVEILYKELFFCKIYESL